MDVAVSNSNIEPSVSMQAIHRLHGQLQFATHYEMYQGFDTLDSLKANRRHCENFGLLFLRHPDAHDLSKV